jgi:phosphoglycerate dehydrogenase-like enzyme
MRIVVSIHDLPVWSIPDAEIDRLAAALPDDEIVSAREADARGREFPYADVLFATRIRSGEFVAAPSVRWMHSSAVGVGPLLPREVVESAVVVTNSRGVHSAAIAEHAVALLLALRRGLHLARDRQQGAVWAQEELQARRVPVAEASEVLVVGLGSIGLRIASMCAGLGMRVTGVRRDSARAVPAFMKSVLPPRRLRDALATADAVVLAAPQTDDTRALIGRDEVAAMKPSAVLVNIARGQLVDDDALIEALEGGRIAGAGLDAFRREPLPVDSPYWHLPNVLVSPHTASFAGDYWAPVVDLFLENVRRFKAREPLLNPVDKRLGY